MQMLTSTERLTKNAEFADPAGNAEQRQNRPAVAYIAPAFPCLSETFVYREIRGLRARGWTVHAVSLREPQSQALLADADLVEDNICVYGRGSRRTLWGALAELLWRPVRVVRTLSMACRDAMVPGETLSPGARLKLLVQAVAGIGLAHQLRARRVGHVHCHFAHAPATVGMYAAQQLSVGFSFTGHANDLFQRRQILKRKLERAAFVCCISEWHRQLYRGVIGRNDSRLVIVRCGVDVQRWEALTARPLEGTLQVLTVCRLVEKKGVDVLIRALALYGKRGQRAWRLTIAGDGPERSRLEHMARSLGCDDRIAWAGSVGNAHIMELMAHADLFALICRTDSAGDRDGIPVVFMEAMTRGLPVVAGDLPAIRELVEDGRSGLLVDGTDAAAVAAAIGRLVGDPALAAQLGAGGRRRVEDEFDLDLNLERLESTLLGSVVGMVKVQ